MDIKRFKAWAESKKLSTDGETGRNYSYTFYDSKTQAAWGAWQAKAQAVPKWISVEEALPPGNILVLAMAQTFSNVFNVYNVMDLDEFQESDITHWMPLPDAPQEPTHDQS